MPREAMDFASFGANIGKQLMGGEAARQEGFTRMAKELSDINLKQAQGAYYQQKGDAERQRASYQKPEFASKIAASLAGLNDAQAGDMETFTQSGTWGMNPAMPDDALQMTVAPAPKAQPEWATPDTLNKYNAGRAAHLINLGGTGDSNADQVMKAITGILDQGRIDSAMKNGGNAGLNAYRAADAGKMYDFKEFGTGDQSTGGVTFNQPYIDKNNSEIGENKAQSASAYASANNSNSNAALHRAQLPEVQSRIDLNNSKIGADSVVINPDGTQTIIKGSGKAGKAPTEFQAKSATFGARAQEAHDIMNELEKMTGPDAYNRLAATSFGGDGMLNTLANPAMKSTTQDAVQAQRDFINAVLRQESGAAIAQSEFDNATRQYFPQPGDKPSVLENKRRNRETTIMGFKNSAGNAAFEAPPIKPAGAAKPPVLESIPDAAIEHLKSHPNLAPAFAAKYGKQATDAALGKVR